MDISDLLSSATLRSLSTSTGADGSQVASVLSNALPVLLSSMSENASSEEGAASLSAALSQHATSGVDSRLSNVDAEDGAKIIGHILGGKQNSITKDLATKSGLSTQQVLSILTLVAPLLLNVLGSKQEESADASSGGLTSILGSLLGGGSSASSGSSLLGGLVGSLLGGGSSSTASSGTGDLLGSLLGSALGGLTGSSGDEEESEKETAAAKKKPASSASSSTKKKKKTAGASSTAKKKTDSSSTAKKKPSSGSKKKKPSATESSAKETDSADLVGQLFNLITGK